MERIDEDRGRRDGTVLLESIDEKLIWAKGERRKSLERMRATLIEKLGRGGD